MVDPIQSKSLFLQPDKEMMKGEGARRRRRLSVEEERWGYREGRGGEGRIARSLAQLALARKQFTRARGTPKRRRA